jgi:hypothetical protein
MNVTYSTPIVTVRGAFVELMRARAEHEMRKSMPVPECGGYLGKL